MSLEFLNLLSQIPDPRRAQGKKWKLGPIVLSTILAVLSGAASYRKVHRFIEAHLERLNEAFGLAGCIRAGRPDAYGRATCSLFDLRQTRPT